jgi:uncharacterized protein (TIGR00296 family)
LVTDHAAPPAEKIGVAVCLYKKGMLRGEAVITDVETPLEEAITRCARAAALHDGRFRPCAPDELPYLVVEALILYDFRVVEGPQEIVVGSGGLTAVRGRERGLLLPHSTDDAHWSPTAFLEMTCRKGGMPPDAWRDKATVIHAFSAVSL